MYLCEMGDNLEFTYYDDLIGREILLVTATEDCIQFIFKDGSVGQFYHDQDCSECVRVDDICGDFNKFIGKKLVCAYETTYRSADDADSSYTWTFYNFVSEDGFAVTVRWLGESNGPYSECVDFNFEERKDTVKGDTKMYEDKIKDLIKEISEFISFKSSTYSLDDYD